MKIIIFFLLLFLHTFISNAQTFEWARKLGDQNLAQGHSVAVDPLGNVVSTGVFFTTVILDSFTMTANAWSNIFVMKTDSAGSLIWIKQIGGGISGDVGVSIITDPDGSIYITGFFSDTVDFDPGPDTFNLVALDSAASAYILKIDPAGNFLWAKNLGFTDAYASSVKTDEFGNVYITGSFFGTFEFEPGSNIFSLTSLGDWDVFLIKLDSEGNFLWGKQFGGPEYDPVHAISVDRLGYIYITGYFSGTVHFQNGNTLDSIVALGVSDGYILQLTAEGDFVKIIQLGGPAANSQVLPFDLDIDSSENIYVAGSFYETADFDPDTGFHLLTSAGMQEGFICKFDSSGKFLWANKIGNTHTDWCTSLDLDPSGKVYITGGFDRTVDFNPGPDSIKLTSAGQSDVFIAKLDESGNFVWARSFGGNDIDAANDIVIGKHLNIYTTGFFCYTVDFDPGADTFYLTAPLMDAFTHKMSQCIAPDIPLLSVIDATLCTGDSAIIRITAGYLNSAAQWRWYAGTCGGAPIGAGKNLVIHPETSETYFVRGEGGCITPDSCAGIAINVSSLPDVTYSETADTVCVKHAAFELAQGVPSGGIYSGTGVSGNLFNPTVAGEGDFIISYTYTDTNGCNGADTSSITVDICAGVKPLEENKIEVYPNPFSKNLKIDFAKGNSSIHSIHIFDYTGRLVYSTGTAAFPASQTIELHPGNLSDGVYFLVITGSDFLYRKKVMKQEF